MRRARTLARCVPVLLVLLAACAGTQGRAGGGSGSEPTVYEANATVLEAPGRGPELCLGAIADSLPPQCGGVPIIGWDWSAVEGEEMASNTTWGEFHVVGTYEGDSFTIVDAGPPHDEGRSREDPVDTPCPEPDGGWTAPDLSKASEKDLLALMHAVEAESDFAGFWIDYVEEPVGEVSDEPGGIIANVAFVNDVEPRRAAIQELWGGRLCLVRFDRTYDELRRIQRELSDGAAAQLGIEVTWSGVSQHENVVEVGVVIADDASRMAVDRRYGPGAVLLDPALEPVDDSA